MPNQPERIHLLRRVEIPESVVPICGTALTSLTTDDPAVVTCKTCLRITHRKEHT